MSNLHAHIDFHATDCDGAISREYVLTMNDDEKASEFGDIEFHRRVVSRVVDTYSLFTAGTLKVCNEEDNGIRLTWSEQTKEGGIHTEALICDDEDCDPEAKSYRDHAAEAAGY